MTRPFSQSDASLARYTTGGAMLSGERTGLSVVSPRLRRRASGIVAVILLLLVVVGFTISARISEQRDADYAESLVNSLLNADIAQVPAIVKQIDNYREWADPLLREKLAAAKDGSPQKLRLSLALLPSDSDQVTDLQTALLNADAPSLPVIRDALQPVEQFRVIMGHRSPSHSLLRVIVFSRCNL